MLLVSYWRFCEIYENRKKDQSPKLLEITSFRKLGLHSNRGRTVTVPWNCGELSSPMLIDEGVQNTVKFTLTVFFY